MGCFVSHNPNHSSRSSGIQGCWLQGSTKKKFSMLNLFFLWQPEAGGSEQHSLAYLCVMGPDCSGDKLAFHGQGVCPSPKDGPVEGMDLSPAPGEKGEEAPGSHHCQEQQDHPKLNTVRDGWGPICLLLSSSEAECKPFPFSHHFQTIQGQTLPLSPPCSAQSGPNLPS